MKNSKKNALKFVREYVGNSSVDSWCDCMVKYADRVNGVKDSLDEWKPSEDVLEIAKGFCEDVKGSLGTFSYRCNNFKAICVDSFEKDSKTPLRVNKETGVLEFSRENLKKINATSDFIFWLVLWGSRIHENKGDRIKTDTEVTKYYLSLGKSKKQLLCCFISMCTLDFKENSSIRCDNLISLVVV